MNTAGWVILFVVLGLITLYLLIVIMDAIFVGSFLGLFDRHKKAMVVCLNLKYDNINKLYAILRSHKVEFDEKFNSLLCEIQRNDFDNPESEACKRSDHNLTFLKDEILYILRREKDLEKHEEIKAAKENVILLDTQYRSRVAVYNADILGYNYWISFFPTRWIWLMFKFRKKDIINN